MSQAKAALTKVIKKSLSITIVATLSFFLSFQGSTVQIQSLNAAAKPYHLTEEEIKARRAAERPGFGFYLLMFIGLGVAAASFFLPGLALTLDPNCIKKEGENSQPCQMGAQQVANIADTGRADQPKAAESSDARDENRFAGSLRTPAG